MLEFFGWAVVVVLALPFLFVGLLLCAVVLVPVAVLVYYVARAVAAVLSALR